MVKKTQSTKNNLHEKIIRLQNKNSELKKELRKRTQQLSTLFDSIPDMVYLKDKNFKNVIVNKAYADYLGLKKQEIIGKKDKEFLNPDLAAQCKKSDEEVFKKKDLVRTDEKMVMDKAKAIYFNTLKSPLFDNKGRIKGLVGISRDLTLIKEKEEQTEKALKEKEILLKEIHHRVKNNMQIISSLLNIQSNFIKDPSIKQIFNQCRSRIKAISLVHERLYRCDSLEKIDFSHYIQTLVIHLMSLYEISERYINLQLNLDHIDLDVNKGIPLALITNELLSNSLQHAFPDQSLFRNTHKEQNRININLKKRNGNVEFIVKDNGIGLPRNFNEKTTKSLGMQLVRDLVKQINGKIKIDSRKGTNIKINFSI
jgi:two-component system, sensor histidine kinase PdtaS